MKNMRQHFGIIMLIAILSAIFWIGSGMKMHHEGVMENCPLAISGECFMTIDEHISLWKGLFTAVVAQGISLLALLFAGVVVAVFCEYSSKDPRFRRFRLALRGSAEFFEIRCFEGLKRAFSQGILHPRLYN